MIEHHKSSEILEILGSNIKKYRKLKSMTLDDVSVISGVSKNYLSSVENAKNNISIESLELIAQALDVPVATLLIK